MQDKKEPLLIISILKTIAFFGTIIAIVGAAILLSTGDGAFSGKPVVEGYKTVDISTLSDFDYEKPRPNEQNSQNNSIPETIKQLNGQKVSITGFMMPVRVDDQGMVQEFALNGNYDMCFYGAPSRLNQWVHVKMQSGAKARFSHNPTTVSGTLEVGELVEGGEVISLYRLNGHKASSQSRRSF